LQPWVMRCRSGLFHHVRFDHVNGSTAQIVATSVVSKDPTISRRVARIDFFPCEADPPIRYLLSALRLCESYRRRWSVRLTSYRDGRRRPANRRSGFSSEPRRVCAYREVRCARTPRHRPASETVNGTPPRSSPARCRRKTGVKERTGRRSKAIRGCSQQAAERPPPRHVVEPHGGLRKAKILPLLASRSGVRPVTVKEEIRRQLIPKRNPIPSSRPLYPCLSVIQTATGIPRSARAVRPPGTWRYNIRPRP
jgi:hypothetical protein